MANWKKEIILFCQSCHSEPYRNNGYTIKDRLETTPNMKVNLTHAKFDLVNRKQIDKKKKFTLIFCFSKVQKTSHC